MTTNGLKWLQFGTEGVTLFQKRNAKRCQKGANKFFVCFKELDVREKMPTKRLKKNKRNKLIKGFQV